jgi:pimeloyl-ACP methyl ester carboxylesterase
MGADLRRSGELGPCAGDAHSQMPAAPICRLSSDEHSAGGGPSLDEWLASGRSFHFGGHQTFFHREGKGRPVIAIHGYPLSSWDWSRIWRPLTERWEVIAPDLLGFGFSDKPLKHTYSVLDHADRIVGLLGEQGIRRCHVLAHDLGVSVAQELLHRAAQPGCPVSFSSVCFLNGGLFAEAYRPRLVQKLLSSPLGAVIGPRIPERAFRRAISEVFGPDTKPSDEELKLFWRIVTCSDGMKVSHLVGRFTLERVTYRDRWVAGMLKAGVPMRLVDGPADPNSGLHMARRYQELIPDPDVVLLSPNIGHWPQLEAPRETFRHVAEFFERFDLAREG